VTFDHNRPDLKIERLMIQAACFDRKGNWAQGCVDVFADGVKVENGAFEVLASPSNFNQVETPEISIHFGGDSNYFFCIGMKVLFEGFPNICDSVLYPSYPDPRSKDRYSLLSFCSTELISENSAAAARFSNRRMQSWSAYISQ
jgi:hypothetical protein